MCVNLVCKRELGSKNKSGIYQTMKTLCLKCISNGCGVYAFQYSDLNCVVVRLTCIEWLCVSQVWCAYTVKHLFWRPNRNLQLSGLRKRRGLKGTFNLKLDGLKTNDLKWMVLKKQVSLYQQCVILWIFSPFHSDNPNKMCQSVTLIISLHEFITSLYFPCYCSGKQQLCLLIPQSFIMSFCGFVVF